jgi:murein DD-endopeptidase MepM/ murein hydrolase activator NlpD
MAQPTPDAKVTKGYGVKGAAWRCGWHTGIDYRAPVGTPITAIQDGQVVYAGRGAGWGPAYGIHIILQHGEHRVIYAHLSKLDPNVLNKKTVTAGELIGLSGATGNCHGPHLHLEARKANYRYEVDAVDPAPLISGTPTPPAPKPEAVQAHPAAQTVHTVTKGQTLGAIAKKYGTTAAALAAKNGIADPNKIKIGQKITI